MIRVSLLDERGRPMRVPEFREGATYNANGSFFSEIWIAGLYEDVYKKVWPTWPGLIETLDGKRARDVQDILDSLIVMLLTVESRPVADMPPFPTAAQLYPDLHIMTEIGRMEMWVRAPAWYFRPTAANARRPLERLLAWARAYPDAHFAAGDE